MNKFRKSSVKLNISPNTKYRQSTTGATTRFRLITKTRNKRELSDQPFVKLCSFDHTDEITLFNKRNYRVAISIALTSSCTHFINSFFDAVAWLNLLRENMVEPHWIGSSHVCTKAGTAQWNDSKRWDFLNSKVLCKNLRNKRTLLSLEHQAWGSPSYLKPRLSNSLWMGSSPPKEA